MIRKVTAKVAYKDDTHREMVHWYRLWFGIYEQFIEEENERMVDYMYDKLHTVIAVLYYTRCIDIERKKYMDAEVDKARGWTE